MIATGCNVVFELIIPRDFTATPYFAFISTGIHTHIPPPPSIPREQDIKEILEVLRPMLTPGMTRSKHLSKDILQIATNCNS